MQANNTERTVFEECLIVWKRVRPDKFVLIHGETVLGFYVAQEEAEARAEKLGIENVFIEQIRPGDQRRYPRYDIEICVEALRNEKKYQFRVFDIGKGGIFIGTETLFEVAERFQLVINLENRAFEVDSVVRWRRFKEDPGGPAGMGIQFLSFPSGFSEVLEEIVQECLKMDMNTHIESRKQFWKGDDTRKFRF